MRGATVRSALQCLLTEAWTHRGLLACLLWPVSLLFGMLAAARRIMYRTGLFEKGRVAVPVIVVGNVTAGGSGKTPVVIALVRHLQDRGFRVGVVSRGYARRTKDCLEVLDASPVSDVGDEPALIQRATKAPVFVARRRIEAARALLARHPQTEVIVCDDGLQHLGLHRDLEICVFDERGIGNGWLLPAGPLREPWPRPADLVLHTGAPPAFAGFTAQRKLAPYALHPDGSRIALDDLVRQTSKPLMALAAIAKPQQFFTMLRDHGLILAHTVALPDHHDFSGWSNKAFEACTLICTEKDAVKLWQQPALAHALAIPLVLTPEAAFFAQFDRLLAGLLNAQPGPRLSSENGHTTT